ncbi:MAG: RimK family alpha-L-glutamate ligase [Pseudomonadales bacterium]
MPELLLLLGDPAKARNDNHERLPRAFEQAGWRVTRADHEAVEITANRITLAGRPPDDFDLVWLLGFGQQVTFFDRLQLLEQLPPSRFVTSPHALAYLHGKHRWLEHMPETHTSTNPQRIFAVIAGGGDWVVKPTAGSYGRDVTLFHAGTASLDAVERLWRTCGSGYLMAQRYLPDIRTGEKRTLIAGGRLVASYLRVPENGLKANLAAGGQAMPTCLTGAEQTLVEHIARDLASLGVGFAAIDTVGTHLMEVNVANPGGLETLERLTGRDHTDDVVRAVLAARR